MSSVAGSPLSPEIAEGDDRDPMRVLVVIGGEADAAGAVRELHALAMSYTCSITLLVVHRTSMFVRSFAPLSGMSLASLDELARHHAAELAHTFGNRVRGHTVDHVLASRTWDATAPLRSLRCGVYDALLLGRPPARRAPRRLVAAAGASDTVVIVATRP